MIETTSYLRSGSAMAEVNASLADAAKMQVLKSIKTKFYIHKSFDLQSDLEFMPYIPSEMANDRGYKKVTNPYAFNQLASPIASHTTMYDGRNNEYYPSSGISGRHYNHINDTPKSRMAFLNQLSPKRTSPSTSSNKHLRRKVATNPRAIVPSSLMPSESPLQYMNHNDY